MSEATKICVIEDDPEIGAFVQAVLGARGFEVVCFERGLSAFEKLYEWSNEPDQKPELLFIDDLVPDILGDALCERMRGLSGYQETPIIYMTGNAAAEDPGQSGGRIRCDAFLKKPFDEARLIAVLHRLLPEREAEKSASSSLFTLLREELPEQGSLSPEALDVAMVLSTLHKNSESGTILFSNSEGSYTLGLKEGFLCGVESSFADDRLENILVRNNILSAEKSKDALLLCQTQGRRLEEILLELNFVSPHVLFEALLNHMRLAAARAFRIKEGNFRRGFDSARFERNVQWGLKIPMPEIIWDGISKNYGEAEMMQKLSQGTEVINFLTPRELEAIPLKLLPQHLRFLQKLDGRTPLKFLLAEAGANRTEATKLFFALACLGTLKTKA